MLGQPTISTGTSSISPVLATCVPPHGWMSTPGILIMRSELSSRGGASVVGDPGDEAHPQGLLGLFARGDVEHDALPELWLAFQVIHKDDLIMHPDQATIAGDHPVFHFKWFLTLISMGGPSQYMLTVFRMQCFRP